MNKPRYKIVIVDVDGVVFKGHYFLRLARNMGFLIYFRTVLLCVLFNIGKISIQKFLNRIYGYFHGVSIEQARAVYLQMPLIQNAKETVERLRSYGYRVVLMSSGVPDVFARDLAGRLSANEGYGIEIDVANKTLTGKVSGYLHLPNGKTKLIEKILSELDAEWQDTIVLVDDRNNLDILKKSGLSIGINAQYSIRKQADYLIDSGNMTDVLDILDITDADTYKTLFAGMRKQFALSWYQEIRRKFLHVIIALVPIFSSFLYQTIGSVLFALLALYFISECLRINGFSMSFFGIVTKSSIRKPEERGIAFGPVTLILGAGLSILIFPQDIARTVIWIVAFSDTAATLIGKSIGKHPIPYSKKKSIEGFAAGWGVAFFCGFVSIPLIPAFIAAFIESLPLKALDNLFVPIGTGLLLMSLEFL